MKKKILTLVIYLIIVGLVVFVSISRQSFQTHWEEEGDCDFDNDYACPQLCVDCHEDDECCDK